MKGNRLIYQNWIVELGFNPNHQGEVMETERPDQPDKRQEQIKAAVSEALDLLNDDEREFIVRYHYMGESYRRIADQTGRAVHKLEAFHERCLKKLRKQLAPLVEELFGIESEPFADCPVCRSPYVDQLNEIIRNRDHRQTWRPILKLFRSRYSLVIKSPQMLIGHEKYH